MTSAWTDTSSAETGSSATMNRGCERERSRDRNALALPARKGSRKALEKLAGEADLATAAIARCVRRLGAPADAVDA